MEIILATIGIVGGSGGIFALIKYIVSAHEKNQKNFLEHLDMKDARSMEVSEKFNGSVLRFNDTINRFEINVEKHFAENKNEHQRLFDMIKR